MTEPVAHPAQTPLIRHIIPVLAGSLVIAMLTIVTVNWLNARGWTPPPDAAGASTGFLLFVLGYRTLFALAGCHLAARLAPAGQPQIRYALAVGVLLLVVGVITAQSASGQFPTWYLLAGIVLPIPAAIVGGGTATRAAVRGVR